MAYAVGVRGRPNVPREFMQRQEMEMARQLRPDRFNGLGGTDFCRLPAALQVGTVLAFGAVTLVLGVLGTMWTMDAIESRQMRGA